MKKVLIHFVALMLIALGATRALAAPPACDSRADCIDLAGNIDGRLDTALQTEKDVAFAIRFYAAHHRGDFICDFRLGNDGPTCGSQADVDRARATPSGNTAFFAGWRMSLQAQCDARKFTAELTRADCMVLRRIFGG